MSSSILCSFFLLRYNLLYPFTSPNPPATPRSLPFLWINYFPSSPPPPPAKPCSVFKSLTMNWRVAGDCINFEHNLSPALWLLPLECLHQSRKGPLGMSCVSQLSDYYFSLFFWLLPGLTEARVHVSGLLSQETGLPSPPAVSESVTLVNTTLSPM